MANFPGTNGDDTYLGTTADDTINGLGGYDTLRGDAGNDTINGGDDDDIIQGGLGLDTLNGGNGIDRADYTTFNGNGVYDLGAGTANLGVFTEQMLNFEDILAGTGNDTIYGNTANNSINGNAGNDILYGGAGNDIINGGNGNDFIQGGLGQDTLSGGNGKDTVDYTTFNGNGIYKLGTGTVGGIGTGTANLGVGVFTEQMRNFENINTGAGDDRIEGDFGDNIIYAGAGNDTIVDRVLGNNTIYGEAGNDNITGGVGDDKLYGGDGSDTIDGFDGNDYIQGGLGNDTLDGGAGIDQVDYTTFNGNSIYNLSTGTANLGVFTEQMLNFENIIAGGGNDTITGTAGENNLQGGDGNDYIQGGLGKDTLNGGNGDDTVDYRSFNGFGIYNLAAGTAFLTGAFSETMAQFENIYTGDGRNSITGTTGDNIIYGGAGVDTIFSDAGNDTIYGGANTDYIYGQAGDDTITGGAGTDYFSFSGVTLSSTNTVAGSIGRDTIVDFTKGEDQIILSEATFNISDQAFLVNINAFAVVPDDLAAANSSYRIVYSQETHNLFYNQNTEAAGFGYGGNFANIGGLATGVDLAIGDFYLSSLVE